MPETIKLEGADSKKNSPQQSTKAALDADKGVKQEDTITKPPISEPLAPPPKPAPSTTAQTPDYFSSIHNNSNEFNPFEQSFGAPSSEKALLPPVSALESPAIAGSTNAASYNWNQGLRAGPLSPAMLEGPAGAGDYFGNISRGFPTPNESSLRTGLTPGGGGSMFPAPSPQSQALFASLQGGGATPNTIDFHRTAMQQAARSKFPNTSNPQDSVMQNGTMESQHDAEAANGLFMLAKGGQQNQFAQSTQQLQQPPMQTRSSGVQRMSNASADNAGSVDEDEDSKPSRGKKGGKAQPTNGRRKSDIPPKANKRQKSNGGGAIVDPALDPNADMDDDSDMMDDDDEDEDGKRGGRKMTDEEKRKNFLERNRVAALKCRQRKKQWLANLQHKVEVYSAENDSLNSQVQTLHEEVRNLRNLLVQHKDCNVSHTQGIGQFLSSMQESNQQFAHQQQMNPYGMAMPGVAVNGNMQSGMQRSG